MASHVVVIDASARRHQVKTTPGKHLSEVLEEACEKLGLNAAQYGLKYVYMPRHQQEDSITDENYVRHNNKRVDLSKPIRLSGLSSGAKLELVQLSKSAGVVSIALQLPEPEASGGPNARLTEKFPSSTTLWQLLRGFETGVAGGTEPRNFTARGVPSTAQGSSGAGRLYYEQPVMNIMNRELASFTDLQKSLAQLGFNTGSALLRLSFRVTETPLEEAMQQIQQYFISVEGEGPAAPPPSQTQQAAPSPQPEPAPPQTQPEWIEDTSAQLASPSQPEPSAPSSSQPSITTSATGRPISVYRPPTASTPLAALMSHNEADYTPTVEHAQAHQKSLQQNSRNVRLKTEAELAAQADEDAAKWGAVKDVGIKIRFPDQSSVVATFSQSDTGVDLYNEVRNFLEDQWRSEAFLLRLPSVKGKSDTVPDQSNKRLIQDLQLKGRVLVTFTWDEQKASVQARSTKSILRPEVMKQAGDLQVPTVPAGNPGDGHDPGVKINVTKKDTSEDGGQSKSKVPKWLKGLSKK